jgi:Protein of unknown function (DUF4232)
MTRGEGATHHRAVPLPALVGLLTAVTFTTAAALPGPPRSAPEGSPARSSEAPCRASQLGARLATRPPTPGREHLLLVLSNRGATSCGMFGFVGLEMLGSDGSTLATDLQRAETSRPPMEVVVPPAGEAAARLSWTTFSTDEACVAPAGVVVTPPNDTSAVVLPWPTTGLVCRFGQLDLEPVHAVTAVRTRPPAATSGAQAAAARPVAPLDRGPA